MRFLINLTQAIVSLALRLHVASIQAAQHASEDVISKAANRVNAHDAAVADLQAEVARINNEIIRVQQDRQAETTRYITVFDTERQNQRALEMQALPYKDLIA